MKQLSALIFFLIFGLGAYHYLSNQESISLSSLPTCDVKPGSVHDGDSMRVLCGGIESRIRLACIDAPEHNQPGGIEARDHLRSLLNQANNKIKIIQVDTDRYNRMVAEVYTGDKLVQLQQVKDGMAWGYERYKANCSQWEALASAQKEAQAAKRGIWASNPVPPWEWRRRNK